MAPLLSAGEPWPPGARCERLGTNFAVFSRQATSIELWIFGRQSASAPMRVPLDSPSHRTGDIWHVRIGGDLRGRCYVFRVTGPGDAGRPDVDPRQFLLDPYAALIVPWPEAAVFDESGRAPNLPGHRFAGVVTDHAFDWQGISSPHHEWADTIIYETHVRGLTIHPSSGALHAGQYLGVIEKIPYLKSLGVTAVELLPVQAFDARPDTAAADGAPNRIDYWGYEPIALFAPHPSYASDSPLESPLIEFKTMVRELHRAGIEVILDVVFNHTGEGGWNGPTYSFRGLDNEVYYLLTPDGSTYLDYTGCGNTLNCNHPVVRSMIMDCLRHWVMHLHVDGFRFDLAAVLGRGEDGALLANPPILQEITEDPILRHTKLIAEAWDAAGAFEVGRFAGRRWGEWNSRFRDDVRRFWRGDAGFTGALASRFCGSADLYQHDGQSVVKSVNFVTSHDGFTLSDLSSYARKHNEANGANNADGTNDDYSANYGTEGPTADAVVVEFRLRQSKNMLATLLLSRGVPMLLGGDEFGRSQQGNNNAYGQDNSVSWYDWTLVDSNAGLVRFVRNLIGFRKEHEVLRSGQFYSEKEIHWLGVDGRAPDWQGPFNRLGCVVRGDSIVLALLFNATEHECSFTLPVGEAVRWRLRIDTARSAPDDLPDEPDALPIDAAAPIAVAPWSSMVLDGLPQVRRDSAS